MLMFIVGFAVFCLWVFLVDGDLIVTFYDVFHRVAAKISPSWVKSTVEGKVVWITGASSGIGEELAYELATYGCKLVLSARREQRLQEVKRKCVQIAKKCTYGCYKDSNVLILAFDVTQTNQHQEKVDAIVSQFGRIDVLVNNAGRTQRCTFEETEVEVFNEILKLDLLAPIYLAKSVLPVMIAQKTGLIVTMNSVAGKFGTPFSSLYCVAKFGLRGLSDALRLELYQHNINLLTVCAGPTETDLILQAFTKKTNITYGEYVDFKSSAISKAIRLTATRCAHLTAIGIFYNLKEIWVSKNPCLLLVYLTQYFPTLTLFMGPLFTGLSDLLRDPGVGKKHE